MRKFAIVLTIIICLSTVSYGVSYTLVQANYLIKVNGQPIAVTPLNMSGTTYLPLRAISEAIGVPIEWKDKAVQITTVDIEELKESCVMIEAYGDGMTSQGSAVYTDYDEVLTSYHVVDQDRNMVWAGETTFTAIRYDSEIDIAVLKSSKEVKPVKIGDSDEVKVGDKVVVIGAPNGKEDTVNYTTVKNITTDIVINKSTDSGSSGGGVFNIHGELIAIIVAGSAGSNESYAIPINNIRKAL